MGTVSTFGHLKNPLKLSMLTITIRLLCLLCANELVYQLFDLFTNSSGTVYLIYPWYYTYSFVTTVLSIPVLIAQWRLKIWAMPVFLVLGAANQALWYSFGVWDYRMTVFWVLFLLVSLWQIADRKRAA